jgi:NitT/TauT family transport system permease protein
VVLDTLIAGIRGGRFVEGAMATLCRLGLGFGISLIVGVILGLLLGRARVLDETLEPLVLGMAAVPAPCWLPVAFLCFGPVERAVVFVVVMSAVFPIALGVRAGIRDTPPRFLHVARNLGASGVRLYTQVVLPAAKPAMLAALKRGWWLAWWSLIAAELFQRSLGLGGLLQAAGDRSDLAQILAVMILVLALGLAVDLLVFGLAERRLHAQWSDRSPG